ncbi:MAG: sigma-70 family RNA polymerase sigma factor [Planctomycetota bacterium]
MPDKIELCINCAASALNDYDRHLKRSEQSWGCMGLSRDDAEQEARLAALEAWDGFDPDKGKLTTHLKERAGYAIREYVRGELIQMGRITPRGDTTEMCDRESSELGPAESLVERESRDLQTMAACLTTLLPKQQMFIVRARFGLDGPAMTWREIASELDVPVSRVLQEYDSAVRSLRAEMRVEEILRVEE